MTERINRILHDLVGLPLTRTTRAADMECMKFGTLNKKDKKGVMQNYGEFGLHLQCPWRLTNDKEIIVGSFDLYEQTNETREYDDNFNWDIINGNLRDVKLRKLISTEICIVKSAIADKFGGLQIIFENNLILTIIPVTTSKSGIEYWRLLDNRDESKIQYLSTSIGFQFD
jgi:hypothetical protein